MVVTGITTEHVMDRVENVCDEPSRYKKSFGPCFLAISWNILLAMDNPPTGENLERRMSSTLPASALDVALRSEAPLRTFCNAVAALRVEEASAACWS